MQVKKLNLEISFKPFKVNDDEYIGGVYKKLFRQWTRLIEDAEQVSLMFWTSDGSEILDYNGNPDDKFEWCYFQGVANQRRELPETIPLHFYPVHHRPQKYMDNPPEYRYCDLKRIIALGKRIFKEIYGKELLCGATFDPGPEFALSDFKYKRHPEILFGETMGKASFVCCYAELHADKRAYAGFPEGIEEGTSFGKFLGRQTNIFAKDMGFDFIWMSNGFGFGMETWGMCGVVLDSKDFHTEKCGLVKEKIFQFWNDFRRECPDFPIETRGTNFGTGKDLSCDGVPLRDIYRNIKGIQAPPNSPWAAINGDFGLELSGWMSHIAELPPGTGHLFRFYPHDPWFLNSPWIERYFRMPHDIYLPLAVARLDEKGNVTMPESVSILTVDDSWGDMPDSVPDEIVPAIRTAFEHAPDLPGPFVWLYPFDEYHDLTYAGGAEEVFAGDWLIRTAMNKGFPLNTVISTGNYISASKAGREFSKQILVTPTLSVENSAVFELLVKHFEKGGKILFYGPLKNQKIMEMFKLRKAEGMDGDFDFVVNGEPRGKCRHKSLLCGGRLDLVDTSAKPIAEYHRNGESRAAAAFCEGKAGGAMLWIRGTNSFDFNIRDHQPQSLPEAEFVHPENLFRELLEKFDYTIRFKKTAAVQAEPVLSLRYSHNAIWMAGFRHDMNVDIALRFPEGAPLFSMSETYLKDGLAVYKLNKAFNMEALAFIDGQTEGHVSVREKSPSRPEFTRHIEIRGLDNAKIRLRAGKDGKAPCVALNGGEFWEGKGEVLALQRNDAFEGAVYEADNLSCVLSVFW